MFDRCRRAMQRRTMAAQKSTVRVLRSRLRRCRDWPATTVCIQYMQTYVYVCIMHYMHHRLKYKVRLCKTGRFYHAPPDKKIIKISKSSLAPILVHDASEALLAFYVVTLPGLSLQPFPLGILFRGLISNSNC